MKKLLCICLILCITLSFCGCDLLARLLKGEDRSQGISHAVEPPATQPATTVQTEPAPTQPTEPPHSPLYIPGLDTDTVLRYFNEVCLDSEYSSGAGDVFLVQKWNVPILYQIYGTYTQEDLQVLEGFVAWLNTVEGFPGMRQAGAAEAPNLRINFVDQQGVIAVDANAADVDGLVRFDYTDNAIHSGYIYYRNDIEQYTRNSVIQEEIYNGLGLAQDTELRLDSLIYSGFSTPQEPTEVDKLLVQLLYHPDIKCGMNADECAQVIRQLYY